MYRRHLSPCCACHDASVMDRRVHSFDARFVVKTVLRRLVGLTESRDFEDVSGGPELERLRDLYLPHLEGKIRRREEEEEEEKEERDYEDDRDGRHAAGTRRPADVVLPLNLALQRVAEKHDDDSAEDFEREGGGPLLFGDLVSDALRVAGAVASQHMEKFYGSDRHQLIFDAAFDRTCAFLSEQNVTPWVRHCSVLPGRQFPCCACGPGDAGFAETAERVHSLKVEVVYRDLLRRTVASDGRRRNRDDVSRFRDEGNSFGEAEANAFRSLWVRTTEGRRPARRSSDVVVLFDELEERLLAIVRNRKLCNGRYEDIVPVCIRYAGKFVEGFVGPTRSETLQVAGETLANVLERVGIIRWMKTTCSKSDPFERR